MTLGTWPKSLLQIHHEQIPLSCILQPHDTIHPTKSPRPTFFKRYFGHIISIWMFSNRKHIISIWMFCTPLIRWFLNFLSLLGWLWGFSLIALVTTCNYIFTCVIMCVLCLHQSAWSPLKSGPTLLLSVILFPWLSTVPQHSICAINVCRMDRLINTPYISIIFWV